MSFSSLRFLIKNIINCILLIFSYDSAPASDSLNDDKKGFSQAPEWKQIWKKNPCSETPKCETWNGVASKGPVNFILPKLSLCGYYQSLVYKDHPVNLAQLNSNIGQVDKTSASIIAMAVRTKLCTGLYAPNSIRWIWTSSLARFYTKQRVHFRPSSKRFLYDIRGILGHRIANWILGL